MAVVTLLFLSLLIFKDAIEPIFRVIVWTFAIMFVFGCFCVALFAIEYLLKVRAQRRQEETKADVHAITSPTGEVYIREMNHKAVWRAGHLQQSVYANGRYVQPTQEEREAYILRNSPSTKIIEGQLKQLESGEKSTTFYDLLRNYPHLMLLANTGAGKTTQMKLAVEYRQQQYPNNKTLWLSTHLKKDLARIPANTNTIKKPELIAVALEKLLQEYHKRMDTIEEESNYDTLIIAMDEWTEIVDLLKSMGHNPGEFLRWVSRGGRKARMFLILASHGGNVKDLDTAGFSSIKSEFSEVHLSNILTKRGIALWQQFDKKSSRVEITLPEIVTPELTDREQAIMKLYWQGIEPYEIAKQVYKGRPGGEQLNRVKETIIKNA